MRRGAVRLAAAALLACLSLLRPPRAASLVLTAPASVAGTYLHSTAGFGPKLPASHAGHLVWAQPRDACKAPVRNAAAIRGNIALARRRGCDFAQKVRTLQRAGATLVVVVNDEASGSAGADDPDELVTMTSVDAAKDVTIPSIFVTYSTGLVIDKVIGLARPRAVVNRTGESSIEAEDRATMMQMLPGMREVVSPFRHLAATFDGSQHAAPPLPVAAPRAPRKQVLSVVLNRGVYDEQIGALGLVTDTRGGLYEPGSTCTSLHGPRCREVKAAFASTVGYQIFAPPNTNLDNNPVIDTVAEEHLKALLGPSLFRRVREAGLLQKEGVHYRVPDSVLPRYEVSGAGTAAANGEYVARQLEGYVGPIVYRQSTPSSSSRVIARRDGRWVLADIGPELRDWDSPRATLYAFGALRDTEAPPVIGQWDWVSGAPPGPTLQYIEPAVGGSLNAHDTTRSSGSAQRAADGAAAAARDALRLGDDDDPQPTRSLGNVTLFAGPGCRGRARTITLAAREPLCTRCFDLCRKFFDGGGKMHDEVSQPHSKVASLRVMEPTGGGTAAASLAVSAFGNCHGTWNYGHKQADHMASYTAKDGCVQLGSDDETRPVHFTLKVIERLRPAPGKNEAATGGRGQPQARPPPPAPPVGSIQTPAAGKTACTNNCSGHGACVVRASGAGFAYECACDKDFAGDDCSKLGVLTESSADLDRDGSVSKFEFERAMQMYGLPPASVEPARSLFDADPGLAIEMAADRAEPQVLTELLVDVRALLRAQEGRERAQQQQAYLQRQQRQQEEQRERAAQQDEDDAAHAVAAAAIAAATEKAATTKLLHGTKPAVPQPFSATSADADHDGTVSNQELRAAMAAAGMNAQQISAGLQLWELDQELAIEMVQDGATAEVMARLVAEIPRLGLQAFRKPSAITPPTVGANRKDDEDVGTRLQREAEQIQRQEERRAAEQGGQGRGN